MAKVVSFVSDGSEYLSLYLNTVEVLTFSNKFGIIYMYYLVEEEVSV
jgi:hypothetical protein